MTNDENDYLSALPENAGIEEDDKEVLASDLDDEDDEADDLEPIDEDEEEGLESDPEHEPLQFMSREQVEAQIADVRYTSLPSKTGHICEMTMKNGYIHIGGKAFSKPHEIDAKTSKKLAYDLAFKKAWDHEVYALADRWNREARK